MDIRRKVSLAAIAIGIVISSVGCSVSASEVTGNTTSGISEDQEVTGTVTASADVRLEFTKTKVAVSSEETPSISAPSPIPTTPFVSDDRYVPSPATTAPVGQVSSPVTVLPAPIRADARVKPPVTSSPVRKDPVPKASPSVTPSREIHVALSGGLDVLDQYRGPVLYDFPVEAGIPPYVAEHDLVGGWERFGSLTKGMTVKMTGLVTGTYTVGEIINVPQGGEVSELLAFDVRPKVMLQTCIPWSDRMIVVGLY